MPSTRNRKSKRTTRRITKILNPFILGTLILLISSGVSAEVIGRDIGPGAVPSKVDTSRAGRVQVIPETICKATARSREIINLLSLSTTSSSSSSSSPGSTKTGSTSSRGKKGGSGGARLDAWEEGWTLPSLSALTDTLTSLPTTIKQYLVEFSSGRSKTSSRTSSSGSNSNPNRPTGSPSTLSSKEVRNLKEELRMVLRLATEGTSVYDEDVELEVEEEECRREAWGLRGGVGLFPPSGGEVDVADAFRSFQAMNDETSDPASQFFLGFLHASGFSGVEQDQSRAILYYTFAALQGLPEAEMVMAFRYWMGIGVKEDCMRALDWYESVAHKSYAEFRSGPPGGKALPLNPTRLSDLAGGVYGMGASVASTGHLAKRPAIKAANSLAGGENFDDVLEYYQYHSDRNHHEYSVILGRIHYIGSVYSVPGGIASGAEAVGQTAQSFQLAAFYFYRAAHAFWGPELPQLDPKTNGLPIGFDASWNKRKLTDEEQHTLRQPAGIAAAYLGRMLLRGEGVEQDYVLARMWVKRSSDLGEKEGHNLLGIIYRDGLGVPVNIGSAKAYFQAAAQMDLAEAKVHLGELAANTNNHPDSEPKSMAHFTWALGNGNPYEAFYHLGLIHAKAARQENPLFGKKTGTCGVAVSYLKSMVERGSWEYDMMGQADAAWKRGDRVAALVKWWIAGEMGYEVAQNNVAFLLDQVHRGKNRKAGQLSRSMYALSKSDKADIAQDSALSSLVHWIRSASQQNVDSLVKVGDCYYQGIGVNEDENRFEKAAGSYQSAADTQASAVAFWNLGWMYENGLGVAQDWHLAKRYYDLCSQTDSEAEWPVMLSLVKLYIRSWWAQLMGGKQKHLALFGFRKPVEDGLPDARNEGTFQRVEPGSNDAARQPTIDDDDLDLVSWARARERDELEDSYDDYLETGRATRRQSRLETDSGDTEGGDLLETIGIALLVLGFSSLMWYRGRMAREREERDRAERRARDRLAEAQRNAGPAAETGFVPAPPIP